jgi:glycosyltransferase involved in cell wall biosynthesis
MRILIISSKFPYPLKDGGAIATFRLATGLQSADNQVYILSFNTQKHFIKVNEIPTDQFINIEFDLVEIDTKEKFLKALANLLFSRKSYILQRFKSKNFSVKLADLLHERHFDVVQIEGLYMMQYETVIRENSNALVAYRPHNLEYRIWSLLSDNSSNWIKRMYYKILSKRILQYERSVLNTYDIILPISPEDASFFEKIGNHKTLAVVPAGFDTKTYEQEYHKPTEHKLFFIGSLEWIPNQEGIIWFINNCWDKLHTKFPKLELHIAGRNTPKWLISGYSRPGIFWAGEVENVKEFIKDKTIMLVPLFSGSGMRIKIIEAFLYSKAVIASGLAIRGTGAADNCELLTADGDIEFIGKISKLVQNEKLFQSLIINGFDHASRYFDNAQICAELNTIYHKELISGTQNTANVI